MSLHNVMAPSIRSRAGDACQAMINCQAKDISIFATSIPIESTNPLTRRQCIENPGAYSSLIEFLVVSSSNLWLLIVTSFCKKRFKVFLLDGALLARGHIIKKCFEIDHFQILHDANVQNIQL